MKTLMDLNEDALHQYMVDNQKVIRGSDTYKEVIDALVSAVNSAVAENKTLAERIEIGTITEEQSVCVNLALTDFAFYMKRVNIAARLSAEQSTLYVGDGNTSPPQTYFLEINGAAINDFKGVFDGA